MAEDSSVQTPVCYIFHAIREREFKKLQYRGADKSLARPGRKQATATEDFEFHISYL